MTPKQACLNLLGLSRRASKQIAGEGLALAAIRNQTAKLVFIASDAGPTTAKKFHDKAQSYDVPVIDTFTKAELNTARTGTTCRKYDSYNCNVQSGALQGLW